MNETLKRALSGAVYIILLLGCISNSKETLAILFGCFMLIGVYEFCKMTALNLYVSIAIAAAAYLLLWNKEDDFIIKSSLIALSIVTAITLLFYLFNANKTNFHVITRYVLLVGYTIVPFIIINYVAIGKNGYNPKILISILILIWTNDTFAYLVGKNFGKHKLFPSVSPKKTIEGFAGGMVFTVLFSLLLSLFFIGSKILYIWIIIAVIVSIFSTLGDLIQSKFKRVAGIKDSGKIMPGHGGILDRLDSIIFVIPFINLYFLISYLIKYYVS